jgi:glucose-1-phosphate cytidylyltransferase
MNVAIMAGGVGTRLAEETDIRPKPMVEIGGRPILWHIMKHFAHHGFTDFVIALGYKGEYIKKYILDYCSLHANLTVSLRTGEFQRHGNSAPDWTVQLIDTGIDTLTAGRINRLRPILGEETFMMAWGDGVSDLDLRELLAFHRSHGKLATLTAVRPTARFGHMRFDGDRVKEFLEKPQTAEGWISGGFFVVEPGIFDYIRGEMTQWEREPLERLAEDGELMAYRHEGFWQCMDTLRDKKLLQDLWESGDAPWATWE